MTPNEIVKALRTRLGVTQGEFAGRAGLNRVYICQLENGPPPRLGPVAAVRILDAYRDDLARMGLDLEDLLRREPL